MYPLSMATENYRRALDEAAKVAAEEVKTDYIGSEHLIYGFLKVPQCEAYKILTEAGVRLGAYADVFIPATRGTKAGEGMTPNTQKMFDRAVEEAQAEGLLASTAHVLNEIMAVPSCCAVRYLRRLAGEELADQKALIENIIDKTESVINLLIYKKNHGEDETSADSQNDRSHDSIVKRFEQMRAAEQEKKAREVKLDGGEKPKTSRRAAQLPDCGIDMTERARRGKMDPVIGRKKEIEKVVQVLARRLKNNPVLIGEPGVGKSAIVEGLSQLIVSGDVPEQLLNKTVFSVDLPGMLAGTRYRGDFEEKLKNLIDVVMKDGDVILFIDEIHGLVGAPCPPIWCPLW